MLVKGAYIFELFKEYILEAGMIIRKSKAIWTGPIKAGKGVMELGSGDTKMDYSFVSRFENGHGTNPEELVARMPDVFRWHYL